MNLRSYNELTTTTTNCPLAIWLETLFCLAIILTVWNAVLIHRKWQEK